MERKVEKWLLLAVGCWNIFNGIFTILLYAPSFRQKGQRLFQQHGVQDYANYSMMDSVVQFIFIFGLVLLGLGLVNCYLANAKMPTSLKSKGMSAWLISLFAIEILMMDWVGMLGMLVLTTIYFARNKSIKMKEVPR